MQLPDAIDRIRRSTVRVMVGTAGNPEDSTPLGTGFFASDTQHVVTAHHVVKGITDPDLDEIRVSIPGPDLDTRGVIARAAFITTAAVLVDVDEAQDLALLRLPEPANELRFAWQVTGSEEHSLEVLPIVLELQTPRVGVTIATSGFPLAEPAVVTSAGVLASDFTPPDQEFPSARRCLADFTVNKGNSGGAVYTVSDAKCVGVCLSGRLAPALSAAGESNLQTLSGVSVFVPAKQVAEFLRRNSLSPTPSLGDLRRSGPRGRR